LWPRTSNILELIPIKGKILTIDAGFKTKPDLRKIVEKWGLKSTGDRGGGKVLALGQWGILVNLAEAMVGLRERITWVIP
jgi:hypothetical protein